MSKKFWFVGLLLAVLFGGHIYAQELSSAAYGKTFVEATRYCMNNKELGFADWKLPTVAELSRFSGKFSGKGEFWVIDSSNETNKAYLYNFDRGTIELDYEDARHNVICIRMVTDSERIAEAQRQAQQQQLYDKISKERSVLESRKASSGGERYWSEKYYGDWAYAKRTCDNLTEGGYTDWRLPTISELRTLVTYAACSRTYPHGGCPITDSNPYYSSYKKEKCHCDKGKRNPLGDNERLWSSTQSYLNGRFWYIFFGSGSIYADKNGDPYDSNYFRCTR